MKLASCWFNLVDDFDRTWCITFKPGNPNGYSVSAMLLDDSGKVFYEWPASKRYRPFVGVAHFFASTAAKWHTEDMNDH